MGPLGVGRVTAGEQHGGEGVGGFRYPEQGPRAGGDRQRRLEVRPCVVPAVQGGRQQAQIARHGSAADRTADFRAPCGIGAQELVELNRTLAIRQVRGHLRERAQRGEPCCIAGERREVVRCQPVELTACLGVPPKLGVQPRQLHPPRGNLRMALHQVAEGWLEHVHAAALAARDVGLERVGAAGVLLGRVLPRHMQRQRERLVRKVLAVVEPSLEERVLRAADGVQPEVERRAQLSGEARVLLELAVQGRHVTDLEEIVEAASVAPEHQLLAAALAGQAEDLLHDDPPLFQVIGPEKDLVMGAEGVGEGGGVPQRARQGERLAAESLTARAPSGKAQLQREPRRHARREGALLIAERGASLLEQVEEVVVDRGGGKGDGPLVPVAQRGAAQEVGRAERACELRGTLERTLRALAIARASLRLSEREQELATPPLLGRLELERLQRALVVGHALLVGEEPQRPVAGSRRVPDRLLRAAGSGGLEEVVRQFVEVPVWIGGVQLLERLGDTQVEPQPACGCQVIVEAVAHEYVGEGIAPECRRALNDNRCPERLVECRAERVS